MNAFIFARGLETAMREKQVAEALDTVVAMFDLVFQGARRRTVGSSSR
jgi:hypothetical protein